MTCFSIFPVSWETPFPVAPKVEKFKIIHVPFFSTLLLSSVTEESRGIYKCRSNFHVERVTLKVFGIIMKISIVTSIGLF